MVVRHQIQRQLQRRCYRAMERLATGRRINRASDDPAGLVISEQLKSQIASLNQEIENVATPNQQVRDGLVVGHGTPGRPDRASVAGLGAAQLGRQQRRGSGGVRHRGVGSGQFYNRTIANAHYNGAATLDGSEGAPRRRPPSSAESICPAPRRRQRRSKPSIWPRPDLTGHVESGGNSEVRSGKSEAVAGGHPSESEAAESTLADADYATGDVAIRVRPDSFAGDHGASGAQFHDQSERAIAAVCLGQTT